MPSSAGSARSWASRLRSTWPSFAIDLGPFDIAAVVVICLMLALGIANAIAFWRYSNALGGRPTLALFVLLIAITWAVVGAGLIHLLFQAFESTR